MAQWTNRTQLGFPRLPGGERILGPLRDGLALRLGEHGKQAHGKGIDIGHVAADEIHPRINHGAAAGSLRFYSAGQAWPLRVPRPPRGPPPARRATEATDSSCHSRPRCTPPRPLTLEEADHGRLLGFAAQAGAALLLGRDAVVGKLGGPDRKTAQSEEISRKDTPVSSC